MMKKQRIGILYTVIFLILIILIDQSILNTSRYYYEKIISKPNSAIVEIGLSTQDAITENFGEHFKLNKSKLNKISISKYPTKVNLNIIGKVINSAEPIQLFIDDKLISKNKMGDLKAPHFWEDQYLVKGFIVNLPEIKQNKTYKITLKSGNEVETLRIYLKNDK